MYIICILLICFLLFKFTFSSINKTEKIIIDPAVKKHYVCWTGGFDSTFIIIYYLLHSAKDVKIQPIYFRGCVDSIDCKNTTKQNISRQNKKYEMTAMNKIRKMIIKKYPQLSSKLLPTLILPTMQIDSEINKQAIILYKIGHISRPRNQFSSVAQIAKDKQIIVAVGVVIDDDDDNWINLAIKNYGTSNSQIDYNNKQMIPYKLFKNFRFPCLYFKKKI